MAESIARAYFVPAGEYDVHGMLVIVFSLPLCIPYSVHMHIRNALYTALIAYKSASTIPAAKAHEGWV